MSNNHEQPTDNYDYLADIQIGALALGAGSSFIASISSFHYESDFLGLGFGMTAIALGIATAHAIRNEFSDIDRKQ